MSTIIFPWPTLSRDADELRVKNISWHFHTQDELGEYELQSEGATHRTLHHGRGWSPDSHALEVECYIEWEPHRLKYGYVHQDSKVGVILVWESADHSVQTIGSVEILSLNDTSLQKIELKLSIPQGMGRDQLMIRPLITVLDPASADKYAHRSGSIIGDLKGCSVTVVLDGFGSAIPSLTYAKKDDPLWYATLDWDDPTEELLCKEKFCININRLHPLHNTLYGDDHGKPYQTELMLEVISDILVMFLMKMSKDSDWADIIKNEDTKSGSLAAFASYWVRTYPINKLIDLDQIERLSYRIRSIVRKQFSKGANKK